MTDEPKDVPAVQGSINITDLLGLGAATKNLAPAATEIVKAIAGGLGKVYEPASIYLNKKAEGAADRQNALADANTYLELQTRSPAVLEAMRDRILNTEYRRQENILEAASKAVEYAQLAPPQAKPVDPDFVAEWIDGVKDVSGEQVREMWSRLLAFAPSQESGRIPKPAVDLLKLFDSEMAVRFRLVARKSYGAGYVVAWPDVTGAIGAFLEEIGAITSTTVESFATSLPWLTIFLDETMSVHQLSARSRFIADVLLTDEEKHTSTLEFIGSIQEFVEYGSVHSQQLRTAYLVIRQTNRKTVAFAMQLYRGNIVQVEDEAAKEAGALVAAISLQSHPAADVLKSELHRMADDHLLRVEHNYDFADIKF